jgi:hypothetical protein
LIGWRLAEVAQIGDAPATVEAVVPFAGVARQVLAADAMEGAVDPDLHVAEQDMDDGQHGVGVFAAVWRSRQDPLARIRLRSKQAPLARIKSRVECNPRRCRGGQDDAL